MQRLDCGGSPPSVAGSARIFARFSVLDPPDGPQAVAAMPKKEDSRQRRYARFMSHAVQPQSETDQHHGGRLQREAQQTLCPASNNSLRDDGKYSRHPQYGSPQKRRRSKRSLLTSCAECSREPVDGSAPSIHSIPTSATRLVKVLVLGRFGSFSGSCSRVAASLRQQKAV